MKILRQIAVCAAVAVSASGCSLLLLNQPPASGIAMPGQCDDSYAFPFFDLVAVAAGIPILMASGNETMLHSNPKWTKNEQTLIAAAGIMVIGGFGFSALEGFRDADECRDALLEWARSVSIDTTSEKNGSRE